MHKTLYISPILKIPPSEIHLEFVRASGPGGQHINKTATAVQLRFDIANSPSLPEFVRKRLLNLPDRRITEGGILIIDARRYKSQERNRQDAIARLTDLVRKATAKSRFRRNTKPTFASRRRRLDSKHQRSNLKRLRRTVKDIQD